MISFLHSFIDSSIHSFLHPFIHSFNISFIISVIHQVNLAVGPGAYRDQDGNPCVLSSVRAVEEMMARDKTLDHEYLPLAGLATFHDQAVKLVLGPSRCFHSFLHPFF